MTLSAIFFKSRHLAGDFFQVKVSLCSFFFFNVTDFGDTLDEVARDVNTLQVRHCSPPFSSPSSTNSSIITHDVQLALSYYYVLPFAKTNWGCESRAPNGRLGGGGGNHNRVGWNSYAGRHTAEETKRKPGLLLRHNRLSAEDCLAPLTLRCFVLQAWHKKDQTAYLCKTEGV